MLVTSREALRVAASAVFPVPPLALPDAGRDLAVEDALESEAVRLFVERPPPWRPASRSTDDNVADVVAICASTRRPAARDRARRGAGATCSRVDELRDRLEHAARRAPGGARDLPERQQTLRGAIEWSYDLLTDDERSVFGCSRSSPARASPTSRQRRGASARARRHRRRRGPGLARRQEPRPQHPRPRRAAAVLHARRRSGTTRPSSWTRAPTLAAPVRRAHAEHYTERALRAATGAARTRALGGSCRRWRTSSATCARPGTIGCRSAKSTASTSCSNRSGASTKPGATTPRRSLSATTSSTSSPSSRRLRTGGVTSTHCT